MTHSHFGPRALRLAVFVLVLGLLWALSASPASATSPRWVYQTSGVTADLVAVDFVDASTGWAVGGVTGDAMTILKTTNGGTTWVFQPCLIQYPHDVDFFDASNGWIVGGSSVIRSRDGGATWQTLPSPAAASGLVSVKFVTSQIGWVVGGSDGVTFMTTDGGDSWTRQPMIAGDGSALYIEDGYFADLSYGWAIGFDNVLLRTTTGGATWVRSALGHGTNLYSVHFSDASNGIVVGSDGIVYTSANGGASWKRRYMPNWKSSLNQVHSGGFSIDAKNSFVFGHRIFSTTDGGAHWKTVWDSADIGHSKMRDIKAMSFISPKIGWGVGFNGTIVKRVEGPNIYRTSSKSYTLKKGKSVTLAATFRTLEGSLLTTVPVILQTSSTGHSSWKSTYPLTTDFAGKASRRISHGKHGTKYYRWYIPAAPGRYSAWTSAQKVVVR